MLPVTNGMILILWLANSHASGCEIAPQISTSTPSWPKYAALATRSFCNMRWVDRALIRPSSISSNSICLDASNTGETLLFQMDIANRIVKDSSFYRAIRVPSVIHMLGLGL
jgi:hypothetical protein